MFVVDDIAIISSSEQNLENMLNILHNWCNKWRMKLILINKKLYISEMLMLKNQTVFKYGECELEIVDKYKYLGIAFNEHLEYSMVAMILVANSAGRVQGAIYNKYRLNKGFGYNMYTKLYHSGVVPILDYCSSVCGYCNLDKIDTVQNRALRLFLGVHKFAPNLSINADMGWIPSKIHRHTEILRMWNSLVKMEDNRRFSFGIKCLVNLAGAQTYIQFLMSYR